MPTLQVRDVPEHIYRRLADLAEKERRSLAQQTLVILAKGLEVEIDPKARRREALRRISLDRPQPDQTFAQRRKDDPRGSRQVKVVLDANCAIEIALNKKEGERLKALLDESDQVLAPDLLVPEFVNALWKYHQFDQLSLGTL